MATELKSARHLPALDGVRGLAVLIVVAYHTGGGAQSSNIFLHSIGATLKAGWSGVTLFFLLSGFLITGILWDSKGAEHWWRNFYMRRLLRISPLYYGSLLLVLVVAICLHEMPEGASGLWVYALYLQNVPWVADPGVASRSLPLGHFWSLAVEEQFYLLWPLLLRGLTTIRQAKYLCLGVFVLSAAFRYGAWMLQAQPLQFNFFLFSRAGELALGGFLAMCYRDGSWPVIDRLAPYVTWLALLEFIAVCIPGHSVELTSAECSSGGLTLIALFYAGLIVLALRDGAVNRVMRMGWLRWAGNLGYGIYVFHVLLEPLYMWLAVHIAPHAGRVELIALKGVTTWVLTTLIAWLSYCYFELPILKQRRYFQNKPRVQRALAAE